MCCVSIHRPTPTCCCWHPGSFCCWTMCSGTVVCRQQPTVLLSQAFEMKPIKVFMQNDFHLVTKFNFRKDRRLPTLLTFSCCYVTPSTLLPISGCAQPYFLIPSCLCLAFVKAIQCPVFAEEHNTSAHLVFPLKLSPHTPELYIRAAGRANVVHDVDMNVIQHHHTAVCVG